MNGSPTMSWIDVFRKYLIVKYKSRELTENGAHARVLRRLSPPHPAFGHLLPTKTVREKALDV
jgi:hypothetical protein